MRCAQCECVDELAEGWIAALVGDPDDDRAPSEVISFCPVCAAREFRMAAELAETYT